MTVRQRVTEDLLGDLFRFPLDPGYADAAARGARSTKVGDARPSKVRKVGTALVCVAFGFLLVVAYQRVTAAEPGTVRTHDQLVADVRAKQKQSDDLQHQADALRDQVTKARDQALANSDDAARLENLAAGTGLGRVSGDGFAVTLTDAPPKVDPVTGAQTGDDNPGLVLDRDLQDVANELWHDGAEAVAVNGQRLSALSTIRAAGGAILVDFRPVTSPYEVDAIGPGGMGKAFGGSPTAKRFKGYVASYRMGFSSKDRKNLTLGAAPDSDLRYASVSPSPSVPPSPSPSGGR